MSNGTLTPFRGKDLLNINILDTSQKNHMYIHIQPHNGSMLNVCVCLCTIVQSESETKSHEEGEAKIQHYAIHAVTFVEPTDTIN